jgi:hypothetical protein
MTDLLTQLHLKPYSFQSTNGTLLPEPYSGKRKETTLRQQQPLIIQNKSGNITVKRPSPADTIT